MEKDGATKTMENIGKAIAEQFKRPAPEPIFVTQAKLDALKREVLAARAWRDSKGMYNEGSDETCDAYDTIRKQNEEKGI